jgi:peptidoglycan/LPS O-acetylase OafA/YrhL
MRHGDERPLRRYDIDWLRVLGMLIVFLFHCARFFDEADWHVKNNQLSFGMSVFVGIVSQWIMPLFFVLSAISAYYGLGRRTNQQYLRERFQRLVIPLMFGIFVLILPQVYLERVSHGQFSGSFHEFFPHYFDGFYALGGNFAWMGLHLWYLEFLFIFSLLTLPLFQLLRKAALRGFMAQFLSWLEASGSIFFMAVPIAISEGIVSLQPQGIGIRSFGGWSPLTYLVLFILGYFIACHRPFQHSIERLKGVALVLGAIATGVGFLLIQSGHSTYSFVFVMLRGFNVWVWLIAILGFGSRYLDFKNRLLTYANEIVLPFYILHQTVIVILGFLIAPQQVDIMTKYFILSTTSFAIIMLLVQLIQRFKILRFLFGMKLH